MIYAILPYALLLLCVIHIIKTRRHWYWIWIVVVIPYVGGIVYLVVELLPELLNGRRIESVRDTLTDLVKPNERLDILRQKAEFSATYTNLIAYADALMSRNSFQEALAVYEEQNRGTFLNDPELMYRIALARYRLNDFAGARSVLSGLMEANPSLQRKSRESLLRLLILENLESAATVRDEYQKTLQRIQDNSIELPYLEFLSRIGDYGEARGLCQKIRNDERSMKINRVRYDRRFYAAVYRLERSLPESPIAG